MKEFLEFILTKYFEQFIIAFTKVGLLKIRGNNDANYSSNVKQKFSGHSRSDFSQLWRNEDENKLARNVPLHSVKPYQFCPQKYRI